MTNADERNDAHAPRLVELRPGDDGRPLFFLLHECLNHPAPSVQGLFRLIGLLDGSEPIVGTFVPLSAEEIEAGWADRVAGYPGVEKMAADHVALIRRRQPAGPYRLAGFSFAGLLAFEAARQLLREGEVVEPLLLIESWATFPTWWQKIARLPVARLWRSLLWRLGMLQRKMQLRLGCAGRELPVAPEQLPEAARMAAAPSGDCWEIRYKMYLHAIARYRRVPIDAQGYLFRASAGDMQHLHDVDPSLGWGGLFNRGFEIVDIDGDHLNVLQEPHVSSLAARVNRVRATRPPAS